MNQRHKPCWRCPTYDEAAKRCRLGKSNPKRKLDAIDLATHLGPQILCLHNPHREPLILRMRYPQRRFIWIEEPAGSAGNDFEVEIVEE